MTITRRELCARLGAITAGFAGLRQGLAADSDKTGPATGGGPYGELTPDPAGIVDLPKGFRYQMFSKTGETMDDACWFRRLTMAWRRFQVPAARRLWCATTR
jgi:hypothetical protein